MGAFRPVAGRQAVEGPAVGVVWTALVDQGYPGVFLPLTFLRDEGGSLVVRITYVPEEDERARESLLGRTSMAFPHLYVILCPMMSRLSQQALPENPCSLYSI